MSGKCAAPVGVLEESEEAPKADEKNVHPDVEAGAEGDL